jgi:SSS family solute:Na+ symporter
MVLDKSHPSYIDLPGLGVILGGMWVANLYYWGCNQYIIQRVLAAKSIPEAQKGLLFAGFLKLLIPLIVVIPGIIAFLLHQKGVIFVEKPDHAYPVLLTLIPSGIRGVAFAALVAAILSSFINSIGSGFPVHSRIYRLYQSRSISYLFNRILLQKSDTKWRIVCRIGYIYLLISL